MSAAQLAPKEGPAVFSLAALAARWGVHIKTVRAAIDRGELRPFRLGRRVIVALAEVERFERGSIKQGRVVLEK